MTHKVKTMQKKPLYKVVEVMFDGTLINLGCLSEQEIEKLVKELQDLIYDLTR